MLVEPSQYQKDLDEAVRRSQAWRARMGASMTQGEVDARRGQGGGYALPGGQTVKIGPDIVNRGLYRPPAAGQQQSYAPANRIGGYIAYDSRRPPPGVDMSSPAQIAANSAAVRNRLAALTGVNQAPTALSSAPPALSAGVESAPIAPFNPLGGTRAQLAGQMLNQPVFLPVPKPVYNQPLPPPDFISPFLPGGSGKRNSLKKNRVERILAPVAVGIRGLTGIKKSKKYRQ